MYCGSSRSDLLGKHVWCITDRFCCVVQVFASLYTLSKNRKATDIRWTTARVVLEFLQVTLSMQQCRLTATRHTN